jgi:hypothetical protein
MSLYIQSENQQMLWGIVNRTAYISNFFSPHQIEHKEQWFKAVIRMFYEQYKDHNLDINSLQELNRNTIAYMIKSINDRMQTAAPQISTPSEIHPAANQQQSYMSPITTPTNQYSPVPLTSRDPMQQSNANHSQLNAQFNQRQQDYQSLLEKKAPAEIDFRDSVKDEAISNMDELIQSHIKSREEELTRFAPPSVAPVANIKSEIIESDVIVTSNVQSSSNIQNVSDKTNSPNITEIDYINELKSEIKSLHVIINDMSANYVALVREMNDFKQMIIANSAALVNQTT